MNLQDVNEPPKIEDHVFSVSESTPVGAIIPGARLVAVDPDDGQTLEFLTTDDSIIFVTSAGELKLQSSLDFEAVTEIETTIIVS